MRNKKKWLWILITLLWISIIFILSAQTTDVSNQVSKGFGRRLAELLMPICVDDFSQLSHVQLERYNVILRKLAHLMEYFVLGVLSVMSLSYMKCKYKVPIGLIICILLACIDEFHQLFVNGRTGQVGDVIIDSVGALAGIIIFCIVLKNKIFSRKG